MSSHYVCHFCGTILSESTAHEFDDTILCEHCLDERTTLCDCCMDRIWRHEAEGNHIYTLCRYCFDNNYVSCTECGTLIHNDDAHYTDDNDEPYCQDCYDKLSDDTIHGYNYKPSPVFYGEGHSLFMGVELEIDEAGESNYNAEQLLRISNGTEEHIYCKHDGSLDDGMEIVSHPMTLDYHMNTMPWKEVLRKAVELGYTSHNAGSCGLHVHCSRNFFGEEYDEQEIAIGRVLFFIEKHWNELVRFSRRSTSSLNRWAAKYATISETILETYQKAKNKDAGRYVALNLTNFATIEFRLFRGTLRYETFIATLQLVDEICRTAVQLYDSDMENLSWSEFVQRIDKEAKPELVAYLKTKKLYINEDTNETEEY